MCDTPIARIITGCVCNYICIPCMCYPRTITLVLPPRSISDPECITSRPPRPPLRKVRAFVFIIFIARRIQHFLLSSTPFEWYQVHCCWKPKLHYYNTGTPERKPQGRLHTSDMHAYSTTRGSLLVLIQVGVSADIPQGR